MIYVAGTNSTILLLTIILINSNHAEVSLKTPKGQCDIRFSTESFSISLPKLNDSETYSCRFTIAAYAPDVCRLRMNFRQFFLNDIQPCKEQYLLIAGRRLCGSAFGGQIFPFSGKEAVMEFRGDGAFPVNIEVEQVRCKIQAASKTCDVTSSAASTEIISPNYPLSYPTPLTCLYQIQSLPQKTCQIVIRFVDFDITNSPNCVKGRLLIDGVSYCGKKTGLVVNKNATGNFKFDFTEGSGQSRGGFRLRVEQIPCQPMSRSSLSSFSSSSSSTTSLSSPSSSSISSGAIFQPIPPPFCCNRQYDSPYFLLVSPGFLDAREHQDYSCIYQILQSSPQTCRIRFTFLHFWLGQEDVYYGCTDAFLEIDGQRYCGCQEGRSFISLFNNGRKEVFLRTKGHERKGFIIEVQQEHCGGIPGSRYPEAITKSPESEVEVFQTNSTIEKFSSRFFLPKDGPQCYQWGLPHWTDKVRAMLDAVPNHCPAPHPRPLDPYPPPPHFIPWSIPASPPSIPPSLPLNPQLPPLIIPPSFDPAIFNPPPHVPPDSCFPTNPIIPPPFIPPVTNPIFPPTNPKPPIFNFPRPPHFHGRCDVFHSLFGKFESPGYPRNYPLNLNCCFRIRQIPGFCRIQFTVLDFDLQWTPGCWGDYLLLDQRARYCGQSLQSTASYLYFRNGYASIDFISDGYYSGRGFRASFKQIPCIVPLTRSNSGTDEAAIISNSTVTPYPEFEREYDK